MNLDMYNIDKLSSLLKVEKINPAINYWMIRTKKGIFYDEFKENNFVALGWNIIDKAQIDNCESNKDIKEKLREKLKKEWGIKNSTIATQNINKCHRFIKEMKDGDIIMIPSAKNEKITFAVAGEYYEEELDHDKEIEVINRIESGDFDWLQTKCPYKKRRKIKIIKTVEGDRLNPNLYKVLASYHGISNINDYSEFILSSIYNLYIWENKLNLVFNVDQRKGINAKSVSAFIYYASNILTSNDEYAEVHTKINLNSPGDILLTISQYSGDIISFLKSNSFWILCVWMSVAGGKIGPLEFNSLLEVFLKYREQNSKLKDDEINREKGKLEIEERTLELEEKRNNSDLSREEIVRNYQRIAASSNSLQINQDAANNIIQFSAYHDDNQISDE